MRTTDGRVLGKEQHPYAIEALFRQCKTKTFRFLCKIAMWNLDQDTCSVTGIWLTSLSSTVLHVTKHGQCLTNDIV
ncbi:hypothetical protein D3C76_1244600 [compost metagenome]